mgnify:CR=1 FL=1
MAERRTLWLHSWTRRAIMVSPERGYYAASKDERWLPISQITQVDRRLIKHPLGDARPKAAPLHIGTLVTIEANAELFARKRLDRSVDIEAEIEAMRQAV